ncbi:MAG: hypothetical protein IPJ43_06705 [Saprospiraceae bacterium]|nr:hypothetical protein [Saprospiraceae bacterium]
MSLLEKLKSLNYQKPISIAMICGLLLIVIFVCFKIYSSLLTTKIDPEQYVIIGCAIILFYIIINVVTGFKVNDLVAFYGESVYSYIGLTAFVIGSIWLFSSHSILAQEDHKWLIKLLSIIYIVLLTILSSVKKIVGIALQQEKKIRDEK